MHNFMPKEIQMHLFKSINHHQISHTAARPAHMHKEL